MSSTSGQDRGVDIIFYIDKSISMYYKNRHYTAVKAVTNLIENLSIHDRFSVLATSLGESTCSRYDQVQGCINGFWSFDGVVSEAEKTAQYQPGMRKQSIEFYDCMQNTLSHASKKIKDKAKFLLKRNLLDDSDYKGEPIWFKSSKDFITGIETMDQIFDNSKKCQGQNCSSHGREKIIIFITDGEKVPYHQEEIILDKFASMQKKNDYQIHTIMYTLGKKYNLLDRLVKQDYNTWHENSENKVIGTSMMSNNEVYKDKLVRQISNFFRTESLKSYPEVVWTWQNPPNFLNRDNTITLSKAVLDDENVPIGVLAFDINADYLFQEIDRSFIGRDAEFII